MGRGSSGLGASRGVTKDGTINKGPMRKIESTYTETPRGYRRGYYSDEVLEAKTDGSGNLTFEYASPVSRTKLAKTNKRNYLTYEVQAGAENGSTFGVNWGKVKSVGGQTYSIKETLKREGFKWDPKQKKWVRK